MLKSNILKKKKLCKFDSNETYSIYRDYNKTWKSSWAYELELTTTQVQLLSLS